MKITRAWAMPSSNTFTIKPIHDAIAERISRLGVNVDPFVRNSPFKNLCVSNDIDSDIEANYNVDALDFMKSLDEDYADMILFDPPYSPRQVSECYKKMGKSVNMQTTQASFWSNLKKEISRVSKTGATVMTFGWNSGGIGIKYGFEIEEILLVAHGGWHNDTIVTIERKLHNVSNDVSGRSDNVDLMVGRCRDCKFSKTRYDWGRNREQRVVCSNEKVFGIDGMDSDGAEQWEAAELHMGLDFGCIHFTPNAMGDSLPPQEKNNE